MSEIDICRDPSMDLLDSTTATRCLTEIQNSEWDVVLVTPPCNTFSRARCVQPGPRPLRSRLYPLGFPWLSDSHRALVEHGNQLVSFSFSVCTAALQNSIPFLLEHPEDLGMTATGHTPASIWQLPEAVALYTHENVMTFAVYQCQFGAASPKPTRFLSAHLLLILQTGIPGPCLDTVVIRTGNAFSVQAALLLRQHIRLICARLSPPGPSPSSMGGEQLCNIWHRHLEIVEMVFISRLERPRSDRRPLQWSIWLLSA